MGLTGGPGRSPVQREARERGPGRSPVQREARERGTFCLVLHSHLPWVMHHGRWPHGSHWVMEAAAECYVPLLDVFDRLLRDGISPRVTVGITPVLAEMLDDPSFPGEFQSYCTDRARAADEDIATFRKSGETRLEALASRASDTYRDAIHRFRRAYSSDIVGALRRLQDDGHIEVITSAATHGYLPLLGRDECVGAQIAMGMDAYRKRFGRAARGIWMPECAYRPAGPWMKPRKKPETNSGAASNGETPIERRGVDDLLRAHGLLWTVVDAHLLKGGTPPGLYASRFGGGRAGAPGNVTVESGPGAMRLSEHEVHAMDPSGLRFLTRDAVASLRVWSAEDGFPGDGSYREFHKRAFPSGHSYWRVTDRHADLGAKELYEPELVPKRVREHAKAYVADVVSTLAAHQTRTGEPGVVAAPFDTELFGHWWHEGPSFLEHVLRGLHAAGVRVATGEEATGAVETPRPIRLPEGSWGDGGGHAVWLNDATRWMWDAIYEAEDRFLALLARTTGAGSRGTAGTAGTSPWRVQPYLEQLARELLLLESSDWPFLVTTGGAVDYAEARLKRHLEDFERLERLVLRVFEGQPPAPGDPGWFTSLTDRDGLFAHVDLNWWRPNGGTGGIG